MAAHVPRRTTSRHRGVGVVRRSHDVAGYLAPLAGGSTAAEQTALDGVYGEQNIMPGSLQPSRFPDDARPVVVLGELPVLPDSGYPEGSTVVLLPGGTVYRNVAGVWVSQVGALSGGIESLASLPGLPNASYPSGCVVYLSTDGKLYRNVAGTWSRAVDGADLVADTVTANAIAAGAVTASEIATDAITAVKIQAGAVTAAKVAAGAITADKIAADAITAGKVSVGGVQAGAGNAIRNPSFEDYNASIGFPDGWTIDYNAFGAPTYGHNATSLSGAWSGYIQAATVDRGSIASRAIPVKPNDVWFISASMVGSSASTTGLILRVYFGTSDQFVTPGSSSSDIASGAIPSSWTTYRGYVTVPADVRWMRVVIFNNTPATACTLFVDDVIAERVAGGLANSDGNVLIDSSGIRVTNGKITVTNAGSTVVIDGTSNMFKIQAIGTLSLLSADAKASTSVTLTGLGALSSTPAHISFLSDTSGNTGNRYSGFYLNANTNSFYAAVSSGGAVTTKFRSIAAYGSMTTVLNGSSQAVVYLTVADSTGLTPTIYGLYYVLKEAAL